jgi:hypothetical protein
MVILDENFSLMVQVVMRSNYPSPWLAVTISTGELLLPILSFYGPTVYPPPPPLHFKTQYWTSEPVFVDLLRSPGIDSQPGGTVRQPYLAYRPARLQKQAKSIPRNWFLGSINVYKYGLWVPSRPTPLLDENRRKFGEKKHSWGLIYAEKSILFIFTTISHWAHVILAWIGFSSDSPCTVHCTVCSVYTVQFTVYTEHTVQKMWTIWVFYRIIISAMYNCTLYTGIRRRTYAKMDRMLQNSLSKRQDGNTDQENAVLSDTALSKK